MSELKGKEALDSVLLVLFSIALCLLILTFSIGLPIYCRPFYYAHIEPLGLAAQTGYSKTEIKAAFNELLDYLTLPGQEFSTGVMAFSRSGKAHFADCKMLFDLNLIIFSASLATVVTLAALRRSGRVKSLTLGKRHASFYAGISAVAVPLVIGLFAAADFERAFTVFHKVFFPNKDNWLFDPVTDEIINALPITFFRNCAILIGVSIVILSVFSIVLGSRLVRKSGSCEVA